MREMREDSFQKVDSIIQKYGKRHERLIANKPYPMKILMRRTFNSAVQIYECMGSVPFNLLTKTLFFYSKDIKMKEFTRNYEAQLELACIDEEKFIFGLHKFYNNMAVKIKKENLWQEYFEFLALAIQCRFDFVQDRSDDETHIIDAYQSLLLQQNEYLRPNKFDFNVTLCGRTTGGELMTMPDYAPNFDVSGYEIQQMIENHALPNTYEKAMDVLVGIYRKNGFDVHSPEEIDQIGQTDRLFTCDRCSIMPYINEYTYDMLPDSKNPFNCEMHPLLILDVDMISADQMVELLHRRAHTLPSNGITVEFESEESRLEPLHLKGLRSDIIQKLKLKELLYDDAIIMLYRLKTAMGEVSGYYNTQTGYFFTPFLEKDADPIFHTKLKKLILYLYACQVCRAGPQMFAMHDSLIRYAPPLERRKSIQECMPIHINVFGQGGKLKDTYRLTNEHEHTGKRAGDERYEAEPRAIQGFIRKVGEGKQASAAAIERAEALGFSLAADETYVQPFIRNVLKLKRADKKDKAE